MNSKGQIIITDILLYIIILILILSMIIYATVILNDNQVTRINNKQMNNLLEDTLTLLTKTSGTPNNWEYLNNNIGNIGLKSNKNQLLSYDKLIKLKNNPALLDKYFPNCVTYSLTLYPKNNPNNKQLIAGADNLNNKKQIQSKRTLVLFDYGFDVISFKTEECTDSCPEMHNKEWICKVININESSLTDGKYYIITDSNVEYIISNTYSEKISGQTDKLCINNQLKQLLKNDYQTVYLHIKSKNNNTYLVYDENNREQFLDSVIMPESYILDMKIAT